MERYEKIYLIAMSITTFAGLGAFAWLAIGEPDLVALARLAIEAMGG